MVEHYYSRAATRPVLHGLLCLTKGLHLSKADETLGALYKKLNDVFKSYCDIHGVNLSHLADGAWTQ